MSRRRKAPVRPVIPDFKYNSKTLSKFISRMMVDGKKSVSTSVVYSALDDMKQKVGEGEVLDLFSKALANVKPDFEVKSRRVGGATYQVPIEVRPSRQEALAMRWVIAAARSRSGRSMGEKLGAELIDAYNSTGSAFRKKEEVHRMAEANKAFSSFRW